MFFNSKMNMDRNTRGIFSLVTVEVDIAVGFVVLSVPLEVLLVDVLATVDGVFTTDDED